MGKKCGRSRDADETPYFSWCFLNFVDKSKFVTSVRQMGSGSRGERRTTQFYITNMTDFCDRGETKILQKSS